jgi:hypothetical protein
MPGTLRIDKWRLGIIQAARRARTPHAALLRTKYKITGTQLEPSKVLLQILRLGGIHGYPT